MTRSSGAWRTAWEACILQKRENALVIYMYTYIEIFHMDVWLTKKDTLALVMNIVASL